MAIPFIDTNPKGNGYFTWSERKAEIALFLFGFLALWVLMVVSGTFLRGPNWNFFGPYEYWDLHRVEPLLNVNVSDFFLGEAAAPTAATRSLHSRGYGECWPSSSTSLLLPVVLARPLNKAPRWQRWMSLNKYYEKMGPTRYYVGVLLVLLMVSLPIKMYLRWAFNLKYIVYFPEVFFNI